MTGSENEKSPTEQDKPKHLWMVKPCEHYKDEYSDCRSFKARFHQYFVAGEMTDCSGWKSDLDNCYKWEGKQDLEAANNIIESEKGRVRQRLQGHYNNDIWQPRKVPLSEAEWKPPLPPSIEKGYEASFLQLKADGIKSGEETLGDVDENIRTGAGGMLDSEQSSYCCIV
ncbi:UPF0545 protein C22orf39 homolog [Folsomia candida]|nr:UPF0545 protein C22orf39 homolog [Folsomia candida]